MNFSMSDWHAVRPWLPPLALSVQEVTSVSVAFLLAATMVPPADPELQAQLAETECIVTEALAKGLSVKVNGSPWQRVIIRMDDAADEAVIIIYGLMPGRQYDIELAMVHAGQVRREITTQDSRSPTPDSLSVVSGSQSDPAPTPAILPAAPDTTSSHSPVPSPFTIEDRLSQLTNSLSLLSSERDSLQSQIKSVRRDGQKADAALRSEIEALKRTFEKNLVAENRAKQKILALQEAVKRTHAGTRATEQELDELECSLPALVEEKERKELEYERVKQEADRVRKQRQMVDERDKKRVDKLRSEHSSLTHKLEKMTGKREKMEGSMLPDLEEQLKQLRKELEIMERKEDELTTVSGIGQQNYSAHSSPTPTTRRRANTAGSSLSGPGPISRPSRDSSSNTTNAAPSPTSMGMQQLPSTHFRTELSTSTGTNPGVYTYPPGLTSAQLGHSFDGTSSHPHGYPRPQSQSHPLNLSLSSTLTQQQQQHVKSYSHPPIALNPYTIPSLPPHSLSSHNNNVGIIKPPSSPTTGSSSSSSPVGLHSPLGLGLGVLKNGVIGSSLGGRATVTIGSGGGSGGTGTVASAGTQWVHQRPRPHLQQ